MSKGSEQEDVQTAKKHMKRCSTPLATRQMQIKTTVRQSFALTSVAIIRQIMTVLEGMWRNQTFLHC